MVASQSVSEIGRGLVYSLCLLVCGIMLRAGVLEDERAYAVIVLVINTWLFVYNCTSWARLVRGNLAWAFAHMERLSRRSAEGQ